jgi:hypothetical protein
MVIGADARGDELPLDVMFSTMRWFAMIGIW